MNRPYRLALDIGTNSIGWACLSLTKKRGAFHPDGFLEKEDLPGGGVLIFPDGRDGKSMKSKNSLRREFRAKRRSLHSRAQRLKKLKKLFLNMPDCHEEPLDFYRGIRLKRATPPPGIYESRFQAAYAPLSDFSELCAVFLHMAGHRQFESTSLAYDEALGSETSEEEENEKAKEELNARICFRIEQHNKETGEKRQETLGGYYCLLLRGHKSNKPSLRYGEGIRQTAQAPSRQEGKEKALEEELQKEAEDQLNYQKPLPFSVRPPRATRVLIRNEFGIIRQTQEAHFQCLSQEEWKQIADLVLEQRPLQPVLPGPCSFLPKEKRAPSVLPSVIRWRLLQECNNLRILPPRENKPRPLSLKERDLLVEALSRKATMTLPALRKELKLPRGSKFAEESSEGKRSFLIGDKISPKLAKQDFYGKEWYELPLDSRELIIQEFIDLRKRQFTSGGNPNRSVNRREIRERAEAEFKRFSYKQNKEGGLGFPPGNESQETKERLRNLRNFALYSLPTDYVNVSLKVIQKTTPLLKEDPSLDMTNAANNADLKKPSLPENKGNLNHLPHYGKLLPEYVHPVYGRISNITVHVALNQLRKLVNALIDQHGKPTQIHVEMSRDMAKSAHERNRISKEQRKNREYNDRLWKEIEDLLGQENIARRDPEKMLRLKLWKLQQERDIYDGKPIMKSEIFTPKYEIDHMVPQSKGGLDKPWNMILTSERTNRSKSDALPEAHFPPEEWEKIKARLEKSDHRKLKYLEASKKEDPSQPSRKGVEVSWITKIALQYLGHLCKKVIPSTGYQTEELRRVFGLRKDRRYISNHFLDAVMVGFADPSRIRKYEKWKGTLNNEASQKWILLCWKNPNAEIRAVRNKILPARIQRKHLRPLKRVNAGELHEQTHYSIWYTTNNKEIDDPKNRRSGETWRASNKLKKELNPDYLYSSRLAKRVTIYQLFNDKLLSKEPKNNEERKNQQKIINSKLDDLPDKTFREKLRKKIAHHMNKNPKDPKKACLETCKKLGIKRVQILIKTSNPPGQRTSTPKGFDLVSRGEGRQMIIKTGNNDRLDFSLENGTPSAKVISLLKASREERRGEISTEVLSFRMGDFIEVEIEVEKNRIKSFWFVKSIVSPNKLRLWPACLAEVSTNEIKNKSEFYKREGIKDRGGWIISPRTIKGQKLRPYKVNILGQVQPFPSPFSWSSKS